MKLLSFDTEVVPRDSRLSVFRTAAREFQVDAQGRPEDFASRWRMLQLGDLNVIHSHTTPLRYRRDAARIAADGENRITIHYYVKGGEVGWLDGRPAQVGPGGAVVWDLALSLDMSGIGDFEAIIVTFPRHLVEEVLGASKLSGVIAPSPALELAARQARRLIDAAETLPDAAAGPLSRALRDMLAAAMLPAFRTPEAQSVDTALFQRLNSLIDTRLTQPPGAAELAAELGMDAVVVELAAERLGGLASLVERRRLLAAYRLVSNPAVEETIEAIAHRCGFEGLPQFSRRFRAAFHLSAQELRRRGRGRLPDWAGAYHVEQLYGQLLADAPEA